MNVPNLIWLNSFYEVAIRKNMSDAARFLSLPVQRVSEHIQKLEDFLGVILIFRNTRYLSLTQEGAHYLNSITPILFSLQKLHQNLSVTQNQSIRVGMSITLAKYIWLPFWVDFSKQYPDITIDLVLSDDFYDVTEQGFDMMVRYAHVDQIPELHIAQELYRSKGGVCASPDYLQKNAAPESLDDLIKHQCLIFKRSSGADQDWTFISCNDGDVQESVRVRPYMLSNVSFVLLDAALQGMGIMRWKGELFMHSYFSSGALIRVLPQYSTPSASIMAIYPERRRGFEPITYLLNFLKEKIVFLERSIHNV